MRLKTSRLGGHEYISGGGDDDQLFNFAGSGNMLGGPGADEHYVPVDTGHGTSFVNFFDPTEDSLSIMDVNDGSPTVAGFAQARARINAAQPYYWRKAYDLLANVTASLSVKAVTRPKHLAPQRIAPCRHIT